MNYTPYNPLARENLGKSVADAMLAEPINPLGGLKPFIGAGVYAIYYTGNFNAYSGVRWDKKEPARAIPIYVGKAVPKGSRKGGVDVTGSPGRVLHNRLGEHAESIEAAHNLDLADFMCRFLVVEDIWIPLGESLLVTRFAPVWNNLVDGFGNHDPGSGRYNQLQSRWDLLHPGRGFALKCKARTESVEVIEDEIRNQLAVRK
jgi:hypothetical protein